MGAGRDWPTAQEAALKLREGTFVAAEAYHTEQLLHGHLAAIDETVRAIVLEGEGRAGERSRDVARALGEIGCPTELLPQVAGWERPILGILPFHLLVLVTRRAARRQPGPDPRGRGPLEAGPRELRRSRSRFRHRSAHHTREFPR